MKKGKTFMFLNVKRVVNVTALSFLLATSISYAQDKNSQNNWTDKEIAKLMSDVEYKKNFINDLIKEITDNYSLSDIEEDEKEEFKTFLREKISTFNRKNVNDLLIDYGFSEGFVNKIIEKVPEIYAGMPNVSVNELLDLSNMKSEDIEKAIQEYLKTGKIEEKYKFIITDELISIIKEKESIIKEKESIIKRGIIAEQGIQKAEQGIQKIKELNKRFNEIMKGIKKTLKSGGIPLKKE